ncbi:histidine kinase N-terminal 7TM domain-containing protein, partial [Planomonospora corallina]
MSEPVLALLFLLSAVTAAAVAVIGRRRRPATPAVGALVVLAAGIAVWSAADSLPFMDQNLMTVPLRRMVKYVGVSAVAAGFHCMTVAATDRTWRLPRRTALWLLVHPVLVVTAIATDSWHHLFFLSSESATWYSGAQPRFGPLFWAHTAYSYGLITAGLLRLGRAWVTGPSSQHRLYRFLLFAAVPPFALNIVDVAGQGQIARLLPVGFCVTAVLCYWALVRLSLYELVPVERTRVFDMLSDMVMTVDASGRVLDLNPAAERMLRQLRPAAPARVTGLPVLGVFEGVLTLGEAESGTRPSGDEDEDGDGGSPDAVRPLGGVVGAFRQVVGADGPTSAGTDPVADPAVHPALTSQAESDYTVTDPEGRRIDLNVRVTALHDNRGHTVGWAFVGRDVTALNDQHRALQHANRQLRDQVATIEALRADLAEQAVRDALTGLHNRRHLMEA